MRQKRAVPRHAVEGGVQLEALPHANHRAAEDFHIAAGVVAADALFVDPRLQMSRWVFW